MKNLLLFTAAYILTSVYACSSKENWYSKAIAETNDSLKLEYLNKAIGIDSGFCDALIARGIQYDKIENYNQAILDFSKAIDLKCDSLDMIYVYRGISKLKTDNKRSSIPDFDNAISINPSCWRAYSEKGIAYLALGEIDSVLDNFQKSIMINSKDTISYFYGGVLLCNMYERNQEALDWFNKLLAINAEHSQGYRFRGLVLDRLERQDDAILDYNSAIRLDSLDHQSYFNRGLIFLDKKKYAEAEADFSNAINVFSKNNYSYNVLSQTLKKSDSRIYEYYFWRGLLRAEINKLQEASADFSHVIDSKNAQYISQAYYKRAEIKEKLGYYKEAEKDKRAAFNPPE